MFKNNKLSVVLLSVIILLLLFIFMQYFFFKPRLVETKLNLVTVTNFEKVGFDWDGDKLSSSMLFSWQIEPFRTVWEEQEVWGREGSWMPNILTAVDSEGLPHQVTDVQNSIQPIYYGFMPTRFQEINSRTDMFDSYYIVIDENGYLWLDPDGHFQDCRWKKSIHNSNTIVHSEKIDESGDNNTIGPFFLEGFNQIQSDTIQINNMEYPMPVDQNWFLLEYSTVNNDTTGILEPEQIEELKNHLNNALVEDIDFNTVLSLRIHEYDIQSPYFALK
jgi:hypothetical protein